MNEENANPDYLFKIVLIGDTAVGKTNILSQFISGKPAVYSKPTIGVEFGSKSFKFQDSTVKAQIWDTAGQERYHAITTAYYRGSLGAIIVYDVTNKTSLDNATSIWLANLRKAMGCPIPTMLLGNKIDLESKHRVKTEEGKERAVHEQLGFFETSALTGENVAEAFEIFIRQIYDREKKNENSIGKLKVRREDLAGEKLKEEIKEKKKSSCC